MRTAAPAAAATSIPVTAGQLASTPEVAGTILLDAAEVRREVLPNGLRVLVRRNTSAPVVAIVTHVNAGYFDETDDVVGIAHVLEHMYFKGTPTRGVGEIARETKASGGYLNAGTIYDHTSYYTVLPASGFAAGLEIQADAYKNSLIDTGELAKEIEVVIQEAKRKADNPSAVATETLYELLHDRHRMRRWRIGREPGLRALTREALLGFYRNFYRPAATVLAIVGDVDPDDALRRAHELYGTLPAGQPARTAGPEEPAHADFRYRELSGDVAQTQLVAGWRTVPTLHPDAPLLDLAATVLGVGRASRLYQGLRERQLAASVSAFNYTPVQLGVFVIHAETDPRTTIDAARAAWAQLRAIREEGVGQLEHERAQRVIEARWLRRLETNEGQAQHLAEWEALGDWRLGEWYLERLLGASRRDVTSVVQRYLGPAGAALVVYRPATAPPVAPDAAAMRALIRDAAPLAPAPDPPFCPAPIRPANGAPGVERVEGDVRVYRTAGGVPILVRPRPGAPIAHFGVFALGGAVSETPQIAGLTTLLTRTALKGTERRTARQLAEDTEMLGATLTATVSAETFGWVGSAPTRHLAAALELAADVAQHATVPDDAFETERTVALSDLAMLRDDMYRYPVRLAVEAAFAGHPYGLSAMGTESSLRAITAAQARAWRDDRVLRAPAVIAVAGDVDPDAASVLVARAFDRLTLSPPEPPPPAHWPRAVTQNVERREKAQTALALVLPGPVRDDLNRHAAHLLAGVTSGLGGRFFEELRDRNSLAYTVHAFATERLRAGMFVSYIATSPEKEDAAREGLLGEISKLRDAPVSDEELARAKTYAIGTHAISQQSGGAVLGQLVDAWLLGGSLAELAEYEDWVRAVTAHGIQALARRYFDPGVRVEGIVRGAGRTV